MSLSRLFAAGPLALGLALLASGCEEPKKLDGQPLPKATKTYSGGADGLHALWADVLEAARRDERDRVHELMSTMIMSDEDLLALFGADRAAYLKPRYEPMIARLVNVGALELVAQIEERKYDDVEVFPIEGSQGPEARAVLESLKEKRPVFGVRVKKKAETRGLRYDFFVYRDARWVTGNLIGKYLVPDGAASRPAVDGGAPPAAPPAPAPGPPVAAPARPAAPR